MIYPDVHVAVMSIRDAIPDSYMLMVRMFRSDVDVYANPANAFIPGTPQWMIDEWVDYTHNAF